MSIKATNWVWGLELPPTPKLILMALADEADDDGNCWPSIKRIARKACVSDRTVRRTLKEYGDSGLLKVVPRTRSDGGQSSNNYTLSLGQVIQQQQRIRPPDNLSPPANTVREGLTATTAAPLSEQCHRPPDTAMSGHDPLHDPSIRTTTTASEPLVPPQSLGEPERGLAVATVTRSIEEQVLAQQLLDELDAANSAGRIKGPWPNYLHGLIARAIGGTFVPAAGKAVAERRRPQPSTRQKIGLPPPEKVASRERAEAAIRSLGLHWGGSA